MKYKSLSITILLIFLASPFANTTEPPPTLTSANVLLGGTATVAATNVAIYTGYALYRKLIKKESYSLKEDLKIAKRVCNALFSMANPWTTKFEKLLAKEIIKNHKLLSYTIMISLAAEGIIIGTGSILAIQERLEKVKAQEARIAALEAKQQETAEILRKEAEKLSENKENLTPMVVEQLLKNLQDAMDALPAQKEHQN
jgi:hypothetical protein